jgi:hypothetical protein
MRQLKEMKLALNFDGNNNLNRASWTPNVLRESKNVILPFVSSQSDSFLQYDGCCHDNLFQNL